MCSATQASLRSRLLAPRNPSFFSRGIVREKYLPAFQNDADRAFPLWAQAARVEAMRAARRAAEAEADDEATDDEAEAAAVEDELLLGCI